MNEVGDQKCRHCGTRVSKDESFCCRGCEYVYHLIQDEGFERFYELRDRALPPVGSKAFQDPEQKVLIEFWESQAVGTSGVACVDFELKGISCVGCVWLIEKVFSRYDGAVSLYIDPSRGTIEIEARKEHFDLGAFAAEIQRFGYHLTPPGVEKAESSNQNLQSRLGICGFLAMNAMAFTLPFYLGMSPDDRLAPLLRVIVVILSGFSLLVGGTYFIRRAIRAIRMGVMHIDLPIALGIVVAYTGSLVGWATGDHQLFYFDFVAIFILLMLFGRWLQERIVQQNSSYGMSVVPEQKKVRILDQEEPATVTSLQSGESYELDAGAWVPVDSRLQGEAANFSLESINGEADPKVFREGETVPSGAIALNRGCWSLLALESWDVSLMKRLFESQNSRDPHGTVMERILKTYIIVVLVLAVGGLLGWGVVGNNWIRGIQVAVSILVVSCPCAIGLAYPRVNDLVAQWLRSRGVYVRMHEMWGRLARIRKIIFDKTGTLTLEVLEMHEPAILNELAEEQREGLFILVAKNLHPVGRSLKEHLLAAYPGLSQLLNELPEIHERVGFGVETQFNGNTWRLGKSSNSPQSGATDFWMNEKRIASFTFSDSVRTDSKECVQWLESKRMEVSVLSGDSPEKVMRMVGELGLPKERGLGGLSPAEKAEWIDRHANSQGMMIGDGANDALAFEKALCKATPVIGRGVLENQSDFFFLGKGLSGVLNVFQLMPLRHRALAEIFALTILYNLIAVTVSMIGWMNPLLAAVLMPISSIVTVSWANFRLSKTRLDRDLSCEPFATRS